MTVITLSTTILGMETLEKETFNWYMLTDGLYNLIVRNQHKGEFQSNYFLVLGFIMKFLILITYYKCSIQMILL